MSVLKAVNRRKVIQYAATSSMGGALALSRAAEIFPTRPITLVVPWLAGGPTDSICRALATAASKILGQPIVIVNKPGVEGTMGAATVARQSNADGYTLANMHTTVLRSSHMRNLGFDPLRELTYIIGFTSFTPGVVVRADAPWKTWAELLLFAKANPGVASHSPSHFTAPVLPHPATGEV